MSNAYANIAALITLAAPIFTGIGLLIPKLIEWLTGRKTIQVNEAEKIRDYIADQLKQRDARIASVELDLTRWRNQYYEMRELYQDLRSKYQSLVFLFRNHGLGHLLNDDMLLDDDDKDRTPAKQPKDKES